MPGIVIDEKNLALFIEGCISARDVVTHFALEGEFPIHQLYRQDVLEQHGFVPEVSILFDNENGLSVCTIMWRIPHAGVYESGWNCSRAYADSDIEAARNAVANSKPLMMKRVQWDIYNTSLHFALEAAELMSRPEKRRRKPSRPDNVISFSEHASRVIRKYADAPVAALGEK